MRRSHLEQKQRLLFQEGGVLVIVKYFSDTFFEPYTAVESMRLVREAISKNYNTKDFDILYVTEYGRVQSENIDNKNFIRNIKNFSPRSNAIAIDRSSWESVMSEFVPPSKNFSLPLEFTFSEFIYLMLNPDVAEAVKAGKCESGLAHYKKYGMKEGRLTSRWSKQLHFINDYRSLVKRLINENSENIDLAMSIAIGSPTLESFKLFGDCQYYILKKFGLEDGMCIYDLACGSGQTAQALKRFEWRGVYKGADIIEELIDFARSKQPDYEFFLHFDFSINSQDESLDMVFSWILFTHLLPEESFAYIRDAYRALKPGARLIFSFLELDQEKHWNVFMSRVNQISSGKSPVRLDYIFDRKMIQKISDTVGFRSISYVNGDDGVSFPLGAFGQSLAILTK